MSAREDRTRSVLLAMLAQGARSGYELRRDIDRSVGHFWQESFGQIYPALQRLADEGLVHERQEAPAGARKRRCFEITPSGRRVVHDWLETPLTPHVERNELLVRVFFASTNPKGVLETVTASRAEAQASLEALRASGRGLAKEMREAPDLPLWLLTARYGELGLEAHLKWCDEALRALRRNTKAKA